MNDIADIERAAKSTVRHRVILGIVFLATIVAAAWALPFERWLDIASAWLNQHPVSGRLLFVLLFVVGTVLMIPGSLLTLIGGYLFGLLGGVPVVLAGVVLGAAAAALLSRTIARDWIAGKIRDDPRFVAIDDAIAGKAFVLVVLSRLSLLMPFNLLNVIYGLTRIPLSTLAVASGIGMIPAVVLYVYLGSLASSVDQLLSGDFDSGWAGRVLLVVGLVTVVAVTFIIHRTATSALKRELARNGNPTIAGQ